MVEICTCNWPRGVEEPLDFGGHGKWKECNKEKWIPKDPPLLHSQERRPAWLEKQVKVLFVNWYFRAL